jgi:hypothetical protein
MSLHISVGTAFANFQGWQNFVPLPSVFRTSQFKPVAAEHCSSLGSYAFSLLRR